MGVFFVPIEKMSQLSSLSATGKRIDYIKFTAAYSRLVKQHTTCQELFAGISSVMSSPSVAVVFGKLCVIMFIVTYVLKSISYVHPSFTGVSKTPYIYISYDLLYSLTISLL